MLLTFLAVLLSLHNTSALAKQTEESPVKLKLLHLQRGKPPMRFYHCRVSMQNTSNKPYWIVLPEDISISLLPNKRRAKHLRIPSNPEDDVVFVGKGYKSSAGQVIAVHAFVKPSLNAYHLPAGANIVFKKLSFEAWSKVKKVNVLLARDILVNDKRSLEDWLPFPTMSPKKATVLGERNWQNLNWDRRKNRRRTDFPKERVNFIELKNLYSYEVRMKR